MLKLWKQDWFWLAVNVFIIHPMETNNDSGSNPNDVVSLCQYRYTCGLESAILLHLERFLEIGVNGLYTHSCLLLQLKSLFQIIFTLLKNSPSAIFQAVGTDRKRIGGMGKWHCCEQQHCNLDLCEIMTTESPVRKLILKGSVWITDWIKYGSVGYWLPRGRTPTQTAALNKHWSRAANTPHIAECFKH